MMRASEIRDRVLVGLAVVCLYSGFSPGKSLTLTRDGRAIVSLRSCDGEQHQLTADVRNLDHDAAVRRILDVAHAYVTHCLLP